MPDFDLLRLKLKRYKIYYSRQGNTTVIGGFKLDFETLFWITFPALFLVGAIISIYMYDVTLMEIFKSKAFLILLALLVGVVLNSVKVYQKRILNKNRKLLMHNSLILEGRNLKKTFFKNDINKFYYLVNEIDDDMYIASLFLLDKDEAVYPILSFEEENERFLQNDMKWFYEYFMNHFKIKLEEVESHIV